MQVGRYQLQELLGEGGSAQVYRAIDSVVGRELALKWIHPHISESDRNRFLRETRILAGLNHSSIVCVWDIGNEEGRPFFTMPLLGKSITSLGPLESMPHLLDIFLQAALLTAHGLHYIHQRGMIHRDLSPDNILLDEANLPRIMDFGLVSLSNQSRHLTRTGVTLGTPAYMSPEQAQGNTIDARSDLYSLGAVLYRVACGKPLFVGESDQSVLFQHVYQPPTDPRTHNPSLPDCLANLILRLLSKKPDDRPANAQILIHLLQSVQYELAMHHFPGQYRGGLTRTGESLTGPFSPSRLMKMWDLQLGDEVSWPAAITANGELLAIGTRSELVVVHSSGKQLTTYPAHDEVTTAAAFIDGDIVYASWDGSLRRIYRGTELWTYTAQTELSSAPTVWHSLILVTSRDGILHAVSASMGTRAWQYQAGSLNTGPLIWANTAFLCDEEGWLHAIQLDDGQFLWKAKVGSVLATPALVHTKEGAMMIIATWKGEVHALLFEKGSIEPPAQPEWTYDIEDECWAAPAVANGCVVIAGWNGLVRTLRIEDASDLWEYQLQGRITASPVISKNVVYLASETGHLCAFNLQTGQLLWERHEEVGIQATPLVAHGKLYVAFMDGRLSAYQDI